MSCALLSGACCEFLPKFESDKVFSLFSKGEINLFMAVPTIYYKLINQFNSYEKEKQQSISSSLRRFRLIVSGSAALPISVLEQWKTISGQTLLERYGMTEMGMAISNPYEGKRKPGYIGQSLPDVTIRLVDEKGAPVAENTSGEIQVKGPNVFKEYWKKPEASADAFDKEGWFKTGDIAIYENGSYRILGRNSVDIIKSGGYKISALEIEEILRSHPAIKDCGVVGIPDEEWGEIIGASLVCKNKSLDLKELKQWLIGKLPNYKLPRKYLLQEDLPRNVMGKVTKKAIVDLFKS
jgi:malonyl-CoA/methylmalonyl-CoA synthetase